MKTKSTIKETLSLALVFAVAIFMQFALGGCSTLPRLREPNADKNFSTAAKSTIADVLHITGAKSFHIDSPEDKTVTEYDPSGEVMKITTSKTQEEKYSKLTPYFLNGKFTGEYIKEEQYKPSTFTFGVKDTQFQQPVTGWGAVLKMIPYLTFGWGANSAFEAFKSFGNRDTQVIDQPVIHETPAPGVLATPGSLEPVA